MTTSLLFLKWTMQFVLSLSNLPWTCPHCPTSVCTRVFLFFAILPEFSYPKFPILLIVYVVLREWHHLSQTIWEYVEDYCLNIVAVGISMFLVQLVEHKNCVSVVRKRSLINWVSLFCLHKYTQVTVNPAFK